MVILSKVVDSLILWIDLFTKPNSITSLQIFAMNLPSDVPPSVDIEASFFVIFWTALEQTSRSLESFDK